MRNEEIKKLRKQGQTYNKIGNKFKITSERVRQICHPEVVKKVPVFFCEKHNKKYTKECPLCKIDKCYDEILSNNGNLKKEINIIRNLGRKDYEVQKKRILIRKLYDEFNFPFVRIAKLIGQDRTTVSYNYQKVAVKNK